MLFNFGRPLVVNVESVLGQLVEVGDFLFWLAIFFCLVLSVIETSYKVKWDSPIAKGAKLHNSGLFQTRC